MRKVWLTTAVVLLALGVALAQQQPATGSDTGNQVTVEGCLSGTPGSFILSAQNGQTYMLQGDQSQLKEHVGHTVRITGSESPSTSSTATATEKPPSESEPGAQQMLAVSNIEHISANCEQTTSSATTPGAAGTAGAAGSAGAATSESQQATAAPSEQQPSGSVSGQAATESQPSAGVSGSMTAQAPSDQTEANPPSSAQQSTEPANQAGAAGTPQTDTESAENQAAAGTAQGERGAAGLPQTASPLPLLAILGLGSLATGLVSRRKK